MLEAMKETIAIYFRHALKLHVFEEKLHKTLRTAVQVNIPFQLETLYLGVVTVDDVS